jgi:hypothetical protein
VQSREVSERDSLSVQLRRDIDNHQKGENHNFVILILSRLMSATEATGNQTTAIATIFGGWTIKPFHIHPAHVVPSHLNQAAARRC